MELCVFSAKVRRLVCEIFVTKPRIALDLCNKQNQYMHKKKRDKKCDLKMYTKTYDECVTNTM